MLSTVTVETHPALAVILAAGRSARMGTCKALLPWDGVPLVLAHLACFEGVARVQVVLGHEPDAVMAVLPRGVGRVDPDWDRSDMTARVRFGLAGHRGRAFVVPVDTAPEPAVIAALLAAGDRGVPLDVHGRRGHPVHLGVLDTARLCGDPSVGLRAVAASLPGVPTGSRVCALDFDTPGALADVRSLSSGG